MTTMLRAKVCRALPGVGLLAFFGGCHHAIQAAPRCMVTDARSSLAWAPSDGLRGISGRVLAAESGAGFPTAGVSVEPGHYRVPLSPDGAFRFPDVPPGRYMVRVRAIGREIAEDSVTVGRQGVVVLAALAAAPVGLRECAVPYPYAPDT